MRGDTRTNEGDNVSKGKRPGNLRDAMPSLWRIMRRFWPYTRRYRMLAGGSFLALFAEVGLRLLEPWPIKFIFDNVIAPVERERVIPVLVRLDAASLLVVLCLAVVAIAGLRAGAAYVTTVGFAVIGNRVLTDLRSDLYRHIQGLSLSFHAKARGGELTVRVISDTGVLQEVAVTALLPFIGNVLILFGMVAVMFWLNATLAMLAMVTTPLFVLSTVRLSRRIQDAARQQRRREGAMAATVAESFSAIRVVQALSLEGAFARMFVNQNTKGLTEGVRTKRLAANLERVVDIFIALSTALVLWQGAHLVLEQVLTPGDLLVFLAYLKNAFKPVRDFAKYTGRLAKAAAAGERVLDLLDQQTDVKNLPGAVPAPAFQGAVRFEGVSFKYQRDVPILHNINLEVAPGQHVALVGPSGTGKSTVASLLLRLYDPSAGRVLIDGSDIRAYTLDSVRQQMSAVLQDSLLFAATVRENIAYGAPGASEEAVHAACRLANADSFINALPEGYETVVGERGATFSSGQRQRLAIARAAVRQSPILILDEPTTGLDEENERLVVGALRQLAQGRTTFLITHDLSLAAQADLILYLEDGAILEHGNHAELMQKEGRYAALYRQQATAIGEQRAPKGGAVAVRS